MTQHEPSSGTGAAEMDGDGAEGSGGAEGVAVQEGAVEGEDMALSRAAAAE